LAFLVLIVFFSFIHFTGSFTCLLVQGNRYIGKHDGKQTDAEGF
jgi:hypothetical protein